MLENISTYDSDSFSLNERYLWIWNPITIPPHMGLSVEGAYFSLKSNGVDLGTEVKELIGMISRKKIAVLAVQLDQTFDLSACTEIFSNYERTIPHEITCLKPIKAVLDIDAPQKLSELLSELYATASVKNIFSWNMDQSSIELPEYSTEDIHAHLVSLTK